MTSYLAAAIAFILGLILPLVVRPFLERSGVIDHPSARSSHSRPMVRGMGLALLLALAGGYIAMLFQASSEDGAVLSVVFATAVAAALLGWAEDVRGLPIRARASAQLLIGCACGIAGVVLFDGPWWLAIVVAIGIAGYINVANFMDGINGISGFHGAVVGSSYAVVGVLADQQWMVPAGLIVAAVFLAFVPWNFLKGGAFLGDVGSYLLGASVAAIAASAVFHGVPALAVVGPLAIYLADAGSTLIRRAARGERWYEPHRAHVYQRLTDNNQRHIGVAALVAGFSALTAVCGILSVDANTMGVLGSAAGITIVVLVYLSLPWIRRISTLADSQDSSLPRESRAQSNSNPPQVWAVIGASGFIGRAVTQEIEAHGFVVRKLAAPRFTASEGATAEEVANVALREQLKMRDLARELRSCDVVVNAAGVAAPDSDAVSALFGANALLPVIIAEAAELAKCNRLIHLSSAAVQGRRPELDETLDTNPFSPYSRSKALGEAALLHSAKANNMSLQIVIVRATSVQGAGRGTTKQLVRIAHSALSVVASPGDRPTVVSSLRGLVEFVFRVGTYRGEIPQVILQPSEGMTTSQVLAAAGGRAPRMLPAPLCFALVAVGFWVGRVYAPANGIVRRVELMMLGQRQNAAWARTVGFEGPSFVREVFDREREAGT